MASYGYFDHEADVGIVGRGATLEEAFEQAATAMHAIMADPSAVRPERTLRVEFDEPDDELALVMWLNQLLGESRAEGLALGRFHVRRDGAHWVGEAWGQPWSNDLVPGVEVKGATLTMLHVGPADGGWEARCVVDV